MRQVKLITAALLLIVPFAAHASPIFFDVEDLPDISSISISESGVLGEDWEQVSSGGFFPTYTIQETAPHIVTASFASGRTDVFQMVLDPASQPLLPITFTEAAFAPLPGTSSDLLSLENNELIWAGGGGPGVLLEFGFFGLYDPDLYRLMEFDGVFYDFNQNFGLQQIVDSLDQRLLFGPSGVLFLSSSGETFTSLEGFTLTDRSGNLVSYGTPSSVPEPGTLALLGLGLAGMGFARRTKKA